jgi:hypothetical protein
MLLNKKEGYALKSGTPRIIVSAGHPDTSLIYCTREVWDKGIKCNISV